MKEQEEKRKLLTFDLDTKVGDAMLGNYRKAHYQIQSFLTKNGFRHHPQGSTYESIEPMIDAMVIQTILLMKKQYPHLNKIVRDMRVCDISEEYVLNPLFQYDGTPYMNLEENETIQDEDNQYANLKDPSEVANEMIQNEIKEIESTQKIQINDEEPTI
jgi:virulence-associated protein VapD